MIQKKKIKDRSDFTKERIHNVMQDVNPVFNGATEISEKEYNTHSPDAINVPKSKMIPSNLSPEDRNELASSKSQERFVPSVGENEAREEVEELENMFSGEGQTESGILKELFNTKNIKVKTELTADQVSIVSRLELMAKITKRPYLQIILEEFITLQVSKDRKSRMEFVEAHKDRNQQQSKGILSGLLGGGNGA